MAYGREKLQNRLNRDHASSLSRTFSRWRSNSSRCVRRFDIPLNEALVEEGGWNWFPKTNSRHARQAFPPPPSDRIFGMFHSTTVRYRRGPRFICMQRGHSKDRRRHRDGGRPSCTPNDHFPPPVPSLSSQFGSGQSRGWLENLSGGNCRTTLGIRMSKSRATERLAKFLHLS